MAKSPVAPLAISSMSMLVEAQTTSTFPAASSMAGPSSSTTAFTPLENSPRTGIDSLRLDEDTVVLDHDLVGLDRNHAGRCHHLAGLDVELAVVEIALDHVAVDVPLGER